MKVDKQKVIFISVVAVVVIALGLYTMNVMGGKDDGETKSLTKTFVPKIDKDVVEYNSRIKAVDEIKKEVIRTPPSIYDEKKINSVGIYDVNNPQDVKQRMIDSIYANGQMDYSKKTASIKSPQRDWETVKNELNSEIKDSHKDFFSKIPDNGKIEDSTKLGNTDEVIYAEINGDQKVMANGRVQMRITRPHKINGLLYPVNTYIYGFVSFAPNRCLIRINHVDQLPVNLTVYDYEDGGEGLFVVNSFRSDFKGIVVDNSISEIDIPGVPRLGGLKNLFKKSNRNVKITVVNKYQILIKSGKNR